MEKKPNLIEKPMWGALTTVTDLVILNLLWLMCSLPVLTLGASTSALYYCLIKIVRERDRGMATMFFYAFRENLKQGTALTLILSGMGFFLICDLWYFSLMEGMLFKGVMGIVAILGILWLMVISYVFPILAQFENTVVGHLRSALLLGLTNPGKTVLVVILNLFPVGLFLFAPSAFVACVPIWLFCGTSLIAFFNSKILVSIFTKFIEADGKQNSTSIPANRDSKEGERE